MTELQKYVLAGLRRCRNADTPHDSLPPLAKKRRVSGGSMVAAVDDPTTATATPLYSEDDRMAGTRGTLRPTGGRDAAEFLHLQRVGLEAQRHALNLVMAAEAKRTSRKRRTEPVTWHGPPQITATTEENRRILEAAEVEAATSRPASTRATYECAVRKLRHYIRCKRGAKLTDHEVAVAAYENNGELANCWALELRAERKEREPVGLDKFVAAHRSAVNGWLEDKLGVADARVLKDGIMHKLHRGDKRRYARAPEKRPGLCLQDARVLVAAVSRDRVPLRDRIVASLAATGVLLARRWDDLISLRWCDVTHQMDDQGRPTLLVCITKMKNQQDGAALKLPIPRAAGYNLFDLLCARLRDEEEEAVPLAWLWNPASQRPVFPRIAGDTVHLGSFLSLEGRRHSYNSYVACLRSLLVRHCQYPPEVAAEIAMQSMRSGGDTAMREADLASSERLARGVWGSEKAEQGYDRLNVARTGYALLGRGLYL